MRYFILTIFCAAGAAVGFLGAWHYKAAIIEEMSKAEADLSRKYERNMRYTGWLLSTMKVQTTLQAEIVSAEVSVVVTSFWDKSSGHVYYVVSNEHKTTATIKIGDIETTLDFMKSFGRRFRCEDVAEKQFTASISINGKVVAAGLVSLHVPKR